MELQDIKSMTLAEIQESFTNDKLPKFRALQVYQWLHSGAESFDEMSNLSKELREQLKAKYYISVATVEKKLISNYDNTVKYLFSFADNCCVESVVMQYKHGYSICISTQVGCRMGCTFCATGKSGFSRNLTASEMLAQIQSAQKDLGIQISNIVLMGMGEPLDNYQQVLRFLELVSSDEGMNIGMRHISVSTCGIVDKIYDMANRKLQCTLSVSLHAPNDNLRSQTMPINKKWGVAQLLKACKYYSDTTRRRISFEYAMISGLNDSDAQAQELAGKLKGILSHVNLIPVNDVTGNHYKKSSTQRLHAFCSILEKHGITATVRRTLGSDIQASCGQLQRRYKEEVNNIESAQSN